jgi:hypothetical protein
MRAAGVDPENRGTLSRPMLNIPPAVWSLTHVLIGAAWSYLAGWPRIPGLPLDAQLQFSSFNWHSPYRALIRECPALSCAGTVCR